MNRRQFFQTATAAVTASRLVAQDDVPNWGTNVIDIHLHTRQQAEAEWTHMKGCGVTHAVLLTNASGEEHAKEEIANRPGRFVLFVSVDPANPEAIAILRNARRGGAVGFRRDEVKAEGG